MSIYLGDKLYAGASAGTGNGNQGSTVVVNTLYSGKLSNGGSADLLDSIMNYDFLVAVAGISGSAQYQFSGFFSVADIPSSGTRQLYLSTPFELTADNAMQSYCGMVVEITSDTRVRTISKFAGWQSGSLLRLIGIKMSA